MKRSVNEDESRTSVFGLIGCRTIAIPPDWTEIRKRGCHSHMNWSRPSTPRFEAKRQ